MVTELWEFSTRRTFPIVPKTVLILSANTIPIMNTQQTVIVFALIAAMGLVTVVVVDIVLTM